MNYPLHCKELHAEEPLPEEPVIFMKPDSALLKDSKPFFIPDFCRQVDYETELVVRICRLGKNISERFAHRYYDAVTVGIDFTARDLQRRFRSEGKPWEYDFSCRPDYCLRKPILHIEDRRPFVYRHSRRCGSRGNWQSSGRICGR